MRDPDGVGHELLPHWATSRLPAPHCCQRATPVHDSTRYQEGRDCAFVWHTHWLPKLYPTGEVLRCGDFGRSDCQCWSEGNVPDVRGRARIGADGNLFRPSDNAQPTAMRNSMSPCSTRLQLLPNVPGIAA